VLGEKNLLKGSVVLYAEADDVAALKKHIRRHGRADAFVCSNDAIAAVFRQTLEKAGLSVPKDVMLTGFADLPIASLTTPQLTTIRQSRDKMGGAAFKRLLERIENPELPANEILFPAQLVVRDSTKKKSRRTGSHLLPCMCT
jgi:DNA-binding LacI/PurR family transcriptional regulator